MELAEGNLNGRWFEITIPEALSYRDKKTRCASCHGQMYLAGNYTNLGKFRFTPRRSFFGCGVSQEGAMLRHPDALI
jgi:hypothetical protein